MSVRIHCPFCNQKYDLDDFKEGAKVECANCSQKFTLDMMLVDANIRTPEKKPVPPPVSDTQTEKPQFFKKALPEKTPKEDKSSMPNKTWTLSGLFTNVLLVFIAVLLIILCIQISKTNEQIGKTHEQIYKTNELVYRTNELTHKTNELTQKSNEKLDAMSPKSNPIVGYKLIDYTWEYQSLMDLQFKNAIKEGYEPVGYVCQNSIKGGFFLFIKREK